MAIEIKIIKEDFKKDLTNFLIGVAEAGISTSIFPQLAELFTRSLSPTIDIDSFSNSLGDILKQGSLIDPSSSNIEEKKEKLLNILINAESNSKVETVAEDTFILTDDITNKIETETNFEVTDDITNKENITIKDGIKDFAPVPLSVDKNHSFLGNDGDSILITSIIGEDPKPDDIIKLVDPLDNTKDFVPITNNSDKNEITLLDNNNEIFTSTDDIDDKVNAGDTFGGFITTDNFNKDEAIPLSVLQIGDSVKNEIDVNSITINNDYIADGDIINPFRDNTLAIYGRNYSNNITGIGSSTIIGDTKVFFPFAVETGDFDKVGEGPGDSLGVSIADRSINNTLNIDGRIVGDSDTIGEIVPFSTTSVDTNKTETSVINSTIDNTLNIDGDNISLTTITDDSDKLSESIEDFIVENSSIKKEGDLLRSITAAAVKIIEASQKSNKKTIQSELLLYNVLPYSLNSYSNFFTNGISNVVNEFSDSGLLSGTASLVDFVASAVNSTSILKNFTAVEMGLFASNFFSLRVHRGITIKDPRRAGAGTPFGVPFVPGVAEQIDYSTSKKLRVFGVTSLVESTAFNDFLSTVVDYVNTTMPGILTLFPNLLDNEEEVRKLFEESQRNPKEWNLSYISKTLVEARSNKRSEEVKIPISSDHQENLKKDSSISLSPGSTSGSITINYKNVPNKDDGDITYDTAYNGDDFTKLKSKLDDKDGVWEIGSIYIWPIVSSDEDMSPFYVPFQFNPNITEGGITARYTATSILSRIGNLQSFTGVDSLTVSVNTSYRPTQTGNNFFSMNGIQEIELAYRSLTMPWFSNTDSSVGDDYKYYKPPLIKIVMGNKERVNTSSKGIKTANGPFSNLLTYPDEVLRGRNISKNLNHFKTFIATSVAITRNESLPYYMEEDAGKYLVKDTMGFDVNVSLTEVTSNYHQILPGFKGYYDGASSLTQ